MSTTAPQRTATAPAWRRGGGPSRRWLLVTAFFAAFVRVGGDWDWLVAMGDHVRAATARSRTTCPSPPADTSGWHNVPVLAQLVASGRRTTSASRQPCLAHVVAVVRRRMAVLAAHGAVRAARATATSPVRSLALVAGRPVDAWASCGADVLAGAVRAAARARRAPGAASPDRRIWWAVPAGRRAGATCTAAALLGVCVLGAYLVVERIRLATFWLATAVGVCEPARAVRHPAAAGAPRPTTPTVFDNVVGRARRGVVGPAQPRHALRRRHARVRRPSSSPLVPARASAPVGVRRGRRAVPGHRERGPPRRVAAHPARGPRRGVAVPSDAARR